MIEKEYDIGGKTYIQRQLVWGQLRQLLSVLKTVEIPGSANVFGLIDAFGDRLPLMLAIVLTAKGASPKDTDITAAADELAYCISMDTAIQVVEDFFTCNPVSSLLDRLTGIMKKAVGNPPSIGSTGSSSPSAEGTSHDETLSSGAIL